MAATLRRNRKRRGKAKWRQHLAAGGACGISAGADCRAAGPDVGRDRRGDAQAKDCRQPQRGVAVLHAAQYQLQKKLCTRRSRSARTWRAPGGAGCESKACLTRRGWCSSTKPARTPRWCGCAAGSAWRTARRLRAAGTLENNHLRGRPAATRNDRTFCARRSHERADVSRLREAMPCPTLKRGEIVLMDNLPVHKVAGVAEAIEASGRDADLSSEVFAGPQPDRDWPSANSRRICARRPSNDLRASCVGSVASLPISAAQECTNYFRHAGYAST